MCGDQPKATERNLINSSLRGSACFSLDLALVLWSSSQGSWLQIIKPQFSVFRLNLCRQRALELLVSIDCIKVLRSHKHEGFRSLKLTFQRVTQSFCCQTLANHFPSTKAYKMSAAWASLPTGLSLPWDLGSNSLLGIYWLLDPRKAVHVYHPPSKNFLELFGRSASPSTISMAQNHTSVKVFLVFK